VQTSDDTLVSSLDELVVLSEPAAHPRAVALLKRLGAGDLRVAMVGEAKRGKSTLANALLGEEVLPAGVVPVTAISTEVRAGAPRRLEVTLTDGSVHTADVGHVDRYVTERHNGRNHRHVEAVRIHLPAGLPHPRMVLLDTPGVGSVHLHNTEAAQEAFTAMDAAVFVLTADPPISASELELLQQVTDQAVRVFVVLNKADQLEPGELAEASDFVRDVVAGALGARPELFVCSARAGLRARTAGDQAGWTASGVPAFLDALVGHLVENRERDLRASVAAAAARLALQQLDGATVTLAAVEALAADQQHRLDELTTRLAALDERKDQAVDLVTTNLARGRAQLDEDAVRVVAEVSRAVRGRLEEFFVGAEALSAADLEEQGRQVIAETTQAEVEAWRAHWHGRLSDAFARLGELEQGLLAEASGELHTAAQDLLGVRLRSETPVLAPPTLAKLRYDFDPGIGWNQALVSGLRTHAPFGIARRRVAGYLRTEVTGLVDKHVGRARADFQDRIEEAGRRLRGQVAEAFVDLTAAMASGRDAAEQLRRTGGPGHRSERDRLRRHRDALEELAGRLRTVADERVPASSTPGPHGSTATKEETQ
jgi:GTP-binding protein EngB required for normal cell division